MHSSSLATLNTQATPQTILVVDDEQLNRLVLCNILRKQGFETVQAGNGIDALNAIETQRFDLILLDIYMPRLDGFQTLAQIRQKFGPDELPVIMVTADNESTKIVQAFQLGANDYIAKPYDHAVTIARIKMHLQFIQSQQALRKSEERYSLVARGTNDGLWDWDLDTNQIYYSERWISMLAIEDDSNSCSPDLWFSRVHEEDLPRVESLLENHKLGQSPHFEAELRMRRNNGEFRWMRCRGLAVWDEGGVARRIAGSLTDITEGKVADALTGLPNRVLFRERLERCSNQQERDPNFRYAVLYLDLDNFKQVNDSLGHEAGDRLLVAISRRMEKALRSAESFVCRLGGDEFSILIEGIDSVTAPIEVAKRILDSVNSPISLGNSREIVAGVSVGISCSAENFNDPSEILQAADTAMYRAKEEGKSNYCVFDPAMKESVSRKSRIETELRNAIDRDKLFVHYLPVVELDSMKVVGLEALARWEHPKMGMISPAEFIPVAQESGLIVDLGRQILRKACIQMSIWRKNARFKDIHVSVNWSLTQLLSPDLIGDFTTLLNEWNLQPGDLQIEVTEDISKEDADRVVELMLKLKSLGVRIAIDDFGTGFSSLSYLQQLSLDAVKIDASFVDQMENSSDKKTIVKTIIALADGFGIDVVAEGVESETQRRMLAEMGCSLGQGFLFSKPISAESIKKLISEIEKDSNSLVGQS